VPRTKIALPTRAGKPPHSPKALCRGFGRNRWTNSTAWGDAAGWQGGVGGCREAVGVAYSWVRFSRPGRRTVWSVRAGGGVLADCRRCQAPTPTPPERGSRFRAYSVFPGWAEGCEGWSRASAGAAAQRSDRRNGTFGISTQTRSSE